MNLRILKKLSKRAVPMLALLGDDRQVFAAVKDDNYTNIIIYERKHWERGWSVHADLHDEYEVKSLRPNGRFVYMKPPSHPRKGTPMVGAMLGYYEPEWEEETAFEALQDIVWNAFANWDDEGRPTRTRSLRTAREIFTAAEEIIAALQAEMRL